MQKYAKLCRNFRCRTTCEANKEEQKLYLESMDLVEQTHKTEDLCTENKIQQVPCFHNRKQGTFDRLTGRTGYLSGRFALFCCL